MQNKRPDCLAGEVSLVLKQLRQLFCNYRCSVTVETAALQFQVFRNSWDNCSTMTTVPQCKPKTASGFDKPEAVGLQIVVKDRVM